MPIDPAGPLPRRNQRQLSRAQLDMLRAFQGYQYGEGCVRPAGRATARVLVECGFLRPLVGSGGWHKVTPAGVALLAEGGDDAR